MSRPGHVKPCVEALEAKIVLSAAAPTGVTSAPAIVETSTAQARVPHLLGQVFGFMTSPASLPDVGRRFDFQGSGWVGPLGQVHLKGSLTTPGFVANGHAGGLLTLSNAKGSVTLQLTGPPQSGFAQLPSTLTYKLVSGTGAYRKAHAAGVATLGVSPIVDPPPPGGVAPALMIVPSFTLKFA